VTSGMDKIFPADVPVGTVIEVKGGNPFKQIKVQPAAHLDRLEDVIILLKQVPVEFPKDANATSAAPSAAASSDSGVVNAAPAPTSAVKKP
jgi:cell shape-determining protein MreC